VYIGKRKKVFNGGHHVKMQIRIVEMEPKRGLNEENWREEKGGYGKRNGRSKYVLHRVIFKVFSPKNCPYFLSKLILYGAGT
jgi:hypothetical protein